MRRCFRLGFSSTAAVPNALWIPAAPGRSLVALQLRSSQRFALVPQCRRYSQEVSDSAEAEAQSTEGVPVKEKPRKREPVNTTTALDTQRELRKMEQRIEEHRNVFKTELSGAASEQGTGTDDAAPESKLPVPTAPGPLRIIDPDAVAKEEAAKDVVVRSRTTTGQVLWPATEEDIEILSQSKMMYPSPIEVEGSTIIRLVRLSDPVTSPVGRTVRNRQFGIRGNERWQLLVMGLVCTLGIYSLGVWQFRRMEWKKDLLEMRRTRLGAPRLVVNSSPFPWTDKVDEFVYRVVDVRGVFDHRREMRVGPRPGLDEETGGTQPGYNIVTPLRLEDGSTVMINRGHVGFDKLEQSARPEVPTWVRVRGVLEEGEVANFVGEYARLKNRPDRNQYVYLVADELAENAGARNHEECKQALITAFDYLYEDDFKAGMKRELPFSMRHKEDYLLFWADEHTHFNYAMQWFGLGSLILAMTVYKFIEVSRWRF